MLRMPIASNIWRRQMAREGAADGLVFPDEMDGSGAERIGDPGERGELLGMAAWRAVRLHRAVRLDKQGVPACATLPGV
jgi:hypothetical protein